MNSGPKWSLRNGAQYRRLCARPGCGAAAVATLRFQSTQRQAWLVELDVNASRTQGDLCARHAAALVLPRGWELHDERAPGAWNPVGSSGPDAKTVKSGSGARRARARRKKSAAAPPEALPGFEPAAVVVPDAPVPPPVPEVVVSEAVVPEVVAPEVVAPEVIGPEVIAPVVAEPEVIAPELPAPEVVEPAAEPVAEPVVEDEPAPAPESPGNGHAARPVPAEFGASDEEDVEEELGEILDARTPLLQRAFRNAKPLTGDEANEHPAAPETDSDSDS